MVGHVSDVLSVFDCDLPALEYAKLKGHKQIVEMLRVRGAQPTLCTDMYDLLHGAFLSDYEVYVEGKAIAVHRAIINARFFAKHPQLLKERDAKSAELSIGIIACCDYSVFL